MATTLKTLRWADLAVGISIFILAALTGCQSPQSASPGSMPSSKRVAIAQLPPPSFDGPNVLPRSAMTGAKAQAAGNLSGPAAWKIKAPPRNWRWVVIHHSATTTGSMVFFDKEHKAKGWDGVGYHFVIGNGTSTADGQVEVTSRWPQQKWGAHAKTIDNRFNEYGIGICLVGNFDVERPSPKQMQSLSRLVSHLMQTYRIPAGNVVGHRDTKPTECPGRYVNIASIRSSASAVLGAGAANARAEGSPADEPLEDPLRTASGVELLGEIRR